MNGTNLHLFSWRLSLNQPASDVPGTGSVELPELEWPFIKSCSVLMDNPCDSGSWPAVRRLRRRPTSCSFSANWLLNYSGSPRAVSEQALCAFSFRISALEISCDFLRLFNKQTKLSTETFLNFLPFATQFGLLILWYSLPGNPGCEKAPLIH